MQRFNSKGSVGSVESCRGGSKKLDPTHMIIQCEITNKVVMLPVTHLVNAASIRMKQHDKATFKMDINSRKQERGVILFFGSQDICSEQLEIFNGDLNVSTSPKKSQKNSSKKSKNADNVRKNHSSIRETGNQANINSQTTITTKMAKDIPRNDTRTTRQPSSSSASTIESIDHDRNNDDTDEQAKSRPECMEREDEQENNGTSDGEVSRYAYDFLTKKYNHLLRQHSAIQTEYDRLKKENTQLRKTTVPMPDPGARQWFINVAKLFSNKSVELDVLGYAMRLGIDNPNDLLTCLQDTTSNTARHVVRLLYSPDQLLIMSGTEMPSTQRQAIREFAEAHRGPITNHKFNEAINGVFRSKKNQKEKEDENQSTTSQNSLEKGQTTIRSSISKTVDRQSRQ